jgi:hypothetical protein
MMAETKRDEILNLFCDRYEGRETEIDCQAIVYGDLLLICEETDIPIDEVAAVLMEALDGR